jgi:hypothetical protein
MLYLSRAFVEFGPFPAEELLSFFKRGLLKDTDYVRIDGTDVWMHVNDWASSPPETKPSAPAKKLAAKKPKATSPAPTAEKKPATKKAKKGA